MNFVDSTLVKLAGPATRKSVFDATALGQILEATYDADRIGPFAGNLEPLFDEVEIGVSAPPLSVLDGTWNVTGGPERTEVHLSLDGLGAQAPRIDAFWRGSILARLAAGTDRVEKVSVRWPDPARVDEVVAAANAGVLPGGAALEQARRAELLKQLKAGFHEPDAFTEDHLAALVEEAGASSVRDLFEALNGTHQVAAVQLTYSAPAPISATRQPLPIAAAILIRDQPLAVAELLDETKATRRRLGALGYQASFDPSLHARHPLIVIWVVPKAAFNDPDWPGANPAARRAGAGTWLAREGIGLAAVGP